jgi:hypothetical protein
VELFEETKIEVVGFGPLKVNEQRKLLSEKKYNVDGVLKTHFSPGILDGTTRTGN